MLRRCLRCTLGTHWLSNSLVSMMMAPTTCKAVGTKPLISASRTKAVIGTGRKKGAPTTTLALAMDLNHSVKGTAVNTTARITKPSTWVAVMALGRAPASRATGRGCEAARSSKRQR